jgi:hypothetical protein
VDELANAIRWSVECVVGLFDPLAPVVSLGVIAALTAGLMLVVARRASPQRWVELARSRIAASIYEMRLYLDHPGRVLRAQGRLFAWTGVYLACLLPTAIILTPPLGLLYLHLDARHGLGPLAAPSTVVVRVELADGISPDDVVVEASGPVRITAPLVRVPDASAVYARVAIDAPGSHHVSVRVAGVSVVKRLDADPDAAVVSPERRGGLAHLWAAGVEPPPGTDAVRAISIHHPDRADWGLPIPWWLYWLGLSTAFALALSRRFGVAL